MSFLKDILPPAVIARDGSSVPVSSFSQEVRLIGIYFSAKWCPPCSMFTPVLRNFYNEVNRLERRFEVIFVSGDHEEAGFLKYFAEMPWKAVPFEAAARISDLHEVRGIPHLKIFDARNGHVITTQGVREVSTAMSNRGDAAEALFTHWTSNTLASSGVGTAKVTPPPSLDAWQRGIKLEVEETIEQHSVVIYSKTWCPFCKQAKDLLSKVTRDLKVIELDVVPMGDQLHDVLKVMTGQTSVPVIYVGGNFIGGFSDAEKKIQDGSLIAMLSKTDDKGDNNKKTLDSDSLDVSTAKTADDPSKRFFRLASMTSTVNKGYAIQHFEPVAHKRQAEIPVIDKQLLPLLNEHNLRHQIRYEYGGQQLMLTAMIIFAVPAVGMVLALFRHRRQSQWPQR